MSKREQLVLYRSVFDEITSRRRLSKRAWRGDLRDRRVFLDWYNVFITVYSAIDGDLVVVGDDAILRDVRGFGGRGKVEKERKDVSESLIFETLSSLSPSEVLVILDSSVSHSGLLAKELRSKMRGEGIDGKAYALRSPDNFLIAQKDGIVCSSDSVVIDSTSCKILDLPFLALSSAEKEFEVRHF